MSNFKAKIKFCKFLCSIPSHSESMPKNDTGKNTWFFERTLHVKVALGIDAVP